MGRPASDEAVAARAVISAAAVRLFLTQGYDATTVEQIARAAGSSRATVFRYFGSKEDILFHRYENELDRLCSTVRERKGSDGRRARTVLLEFAGRLECEAEAFRLELRLIAGNAKLRARAVVTLNGWARVLGQELAAGRGDDAELSARVVAHSGVAALQEAICIWWAANPGTSLVDVASEALAVALPGRRGN